MGPRQLTAPGLLLVRRALRDGAVELHKTGQPNLYRRYVLGVQPTLLGEVAFVRRWGRTGTTPRRPAGKVLYYRSLRELLDDSTTDGLVAQAQRRSRRGYGL